MREFYIQNEYGEKTELQGGSVFLWEPDGLGYEDNADYAEADGFFIETYREIEQVEKSGTLIFKPDGAYKSYRDFANWIFRAKTLTLAYKPGNDWYFVDVDITRMEKTELTIYRTLEVPITFMPLSPWYTPYDLNLVIEGEGGGNIKKYTYTYPYRYSNSARAGILDFTATAQTDCDFEINIAGPVQNPVLTATRLDTNVDIGKIDLSAVSAAEGEAIRFTNVPRRAGAALVTAESTEDLTAQLGISEGLPAFFRIPANVPVEFALTATSLFGVEAGLRIYRYYRTV